LGRDVIYLFGGVQMEWKKFFKLPLESWVDTQIEALEEIK